MKRRLTATGRFLRDPDVQSSLFWAIMGILFCVGGLEYGLRRSGIPGPGFVPFLVGLCLLLLSLSLALSAAMRSAGQSSRSKAILPERKGLWRLLLVIVGLIFYIAGIERIGFILTTCVFLVILLRLEPRRWAFVVPAALGVTVFFYVLFKILLRVPLPQGPFGF